MNLNYIKTNKCPVCGCTEVIEESVETDCVTEGIRVHSNGGSWEHRTFLCGMEIRYIPNFRSETMAGRCKNDPAYLEFMAKYKKDKERLIPLCEDNDINQELIDKIKLYVLT